MQSLSPSRFNPSCIPKRSCHSIISQLPWLKWEVMTQKYRSSTYLHFPKGQVQLYRLTLHLTGNVKRCTVVMTKPILQHKSLTIKRQLLLTKRYSNQTLLAKAAAAENDSHVRKLLTVFISNCRITSIYDTLCKLTFIMVWLESVTVPGVPTCLSQGWR